MTARTDALMASAANSGRQPDTDLMDLKQQLQYLRNELKSQTQVKQKLTDILLNLLIVYLNSHLPTEFKIRVSNRDNSEIFFISQ